MKIFGLRWKNAPKIAVLATGLAVAMMAATISPPVAQAYPTRTGACTTCHAKPGGTVTAVPSTTTPAAVAAYTVLVTPPVNPTGGGTGFRIADAANLTVATGGGSGSTASTFTANMTAPAAAGTYVYTVWGVTGMPDNTGMAASTTFAITVAGAPVVVTTTTTLAVTPASPVVAPANATLTATVTGTGAAGTVQFLNGTTVLGTGTVAAGRATLALTGVVAGNYSYTANFIPTSAAAFTPSTSTAVAYVVTVPVPTAVTTTTALAVTPASPVVAPVNPTLTATVTGTGAAGTVQFLNGTTVLGTGTVAAGRATLALTGVAAGTYSYTANFIPTSAAAFTPSTSTAVAYVVIVATPVVVTTTTALAVTPATAVAPGSATLTATVTGLNAAGTVEFFNGATSLGTSPVAAGLATKPLVGLVEGSYSYTAVFTPTDAAAFTSSTALPATFVVTAPVPTAVTTTTALAVSPATAVAPASATLTATVTGLNAAGTVEFFNGATSLGTSPVAAGLATKPLVGLVEGSYSYTAVFTPTDAAAFTSSTSSAATFVVTPPVPAAVTTTTVLAMSPTDATAVAPAAKTLNATVTGLNAAGTVEFFNGSLSLGSSPVAAGSATLALSDIAVGSYTYNAVFTPTNAALFTSSTSGNLAFTVTAVVPVQVTTTTALAVTPVTPVVEMGNPTLTATVTGLNAAGTVEFFEGTTSLGTPTALAGGLAAKTLSGLAAGSYSYTAVFTPTSAAAFTSSTSAASAYVVTSATTSSATISWMWQTRGAVGSYVLIRGTGFGTAGTVLFGAVPATVVFWNAGTIVVRVPAGNAVDATVPVTVTPLGGTPSTSVNFTMDSGWGWGHNGHDGDDD